MRVRRHQKERGFVLIAMSVTMLLLLAVMGLAFDFGRIYIARNEAQVFTDAAAMAAASKLDGTDGGTRSGARRRSPGSRCAGIWEPRNSRGVVVEFSADGAVGDRSERCGGVTRLA